MSPKERNQDWYKKLDDLEANIRNGLRSEPQEADGSLTQVESLHLGLGYLDESGNYRAYSDSPYYEKTTPSIYIGFYGE